MIEVKISREQLEQSISNAVESGLKDGLGQWQLRHEIAKLAADAISGSDLPRMVMEEVKRQLETESEQIAKSVASDIAANLRVAFAGVLRQTMASMVYGVYKGKPDYMGDKERAEWNRCMAIAGVEEAEAKS